MEPKPYEVGELPVYRRIENQGVRTFKHPRNGGTGTCFTNNMSQH